MKVSFSRYGGWTSALTQGRSPAVLDAETLPPNERDELGRLVRAAFAAGVHRTEPDRRAAGGYTITVDGDGASRTLSVADADETNQPAAAALRDWIEAHLSK